MSKIALGAQQNPESVVLGWARIGALALASLAVAIMSQAASAASISITPSNSFSFPATAINGTNAQTFTVQNVTVVGATITITAIDTDSSDNFTIMPSATPANDCNVSTTLAPGATCTIVVQFAPFSKGALTGYLEVKSDALDDVTVSLDGVAGTTASITPKSVTFPNTPVGSTATPISVTVTNTGSFNMTFVSNFGFVDVSHFDFPVSGNCQGATLAPLDTCTFTIGFHPTTTTPRSFDIKGFLSLSASGVTFTDASATASGTGTPVAPTITSGPTYLPGAVDVPYADVLLASGSPYPTWTITSGNLPAGLTLDGNTGAITGTPTAVGTSNFVVTASNGTLPDATQMASITVSLPALTYVPTGLDFGSVMAGTTSGTLSATLFNTTPLLMVPTNVSFTGGGAGFSVQGTSTCLSTPMLAAGDSCTLDIVVTPTSVGSLTDTLYIGTNPASTNGLALQVTGLSATPSVSPASYNYPNTTIGQSSTATYTVYGGTGLSSVSISTNSALFVVQNNNCGTTIAAGASCTFDVVYSPIAVGAGTVAFATVSASTGTVQSVSLNGGLGLAPVTGYSVASVAFGTVPIGGSAAQTVAFQNSSSLPLTVTTYSTNSGQIGVGGSASGGCVPGLVVVAGGSCNLDVTFLPSVAGSSSGQLTVSFTPGALASPVLSSNLSLGGTGAVDTTAFSTGAFINFGTLAVGGSSVVTTSFQNTSAVSIKIGTYFTSSAQYGVGGSASSGCVPGLVVAAGGSCNLDVTFLPNAASASTDTLTVTFTGGSLASPVMNNSIGLSGTGQVPATQYSVSATLVYGNVGVGTPNTQTIAFQNTSTTAIKISTYSTNAAQFSVGGSVASPCVPGLVVAAGASCNLDVAFNPGANTSYGGNLTVSFTGGSLASPVFTNVLPLTGTGVNPASLSPATVSFGNVPVTVPASQTVTFTNTGTLGAKIVSINNSDSRYTAAGNGGSPCTVGNTVPGGASCTFALTFTPAGSGSYNDTVTFTYQPGGAGATYAASQSANGTGFNMPFTVSPASNSFGSVALGTTNTAVFTLNNTSNTTAYATGYTITGISTSGLGFSAAGSGAAPCVNGYVVPPGSSCSMTMTFQVNSGSTGSYNGSTTISFLTGLGANPTYTATYNSNGTIFFVAPTITSGTPTTPAALGSAYSFPFTASGSPTITWSIATGTLPPGLTLNSGTGVLSGTPTLVGNYSFTVQAANGTLPNATQNVNLSVANPLTVTSTADSGVGTLRDAINYINANCTGQTIAFNIIGTGPFQIQPLTPLPTVSCANSVIDGYTQPGSAVNTGPAGTTNAVIQIWLDGSLSGGTGLSFAYSGGSQAASGSKTVRGLAITNFGTGISAAFNTFVNGNFIGVKPDGLTIAKNGAGVVSQGSSFGGPCCIYVGSVAPADLNMINSTGDGVAIVANPGSTVIGNLFGLDRAGNRAAAGFGGSQAVALYAGTFAPANTSITNNYISNYSTVQSMQQGNTVFSQNVVVGNSQTFNSTFAQYNEIEITQVTYDVSASTTNIQGNINAKDNSTVHRVEVFSNPTNTGTLNLEQYQGNIDVVPATVSLVPFAQSFMGILANPSVTMTWMGGNSTYVPLGYTRPFTVNGAPTAFSAVAGGGVTSQTLTINNTFGSAITFSATPAVVSGTGFSITGGTCAGATISAAGTCTVIVSYSSASAASAAGTLDISLAVPGQQGTTNYAVTTTTVYHAALSGTANAPALSLSTALVDFGTVTTVSATPQNVVVTNIGSVNLIISGVTLTGAAPSDYSVNSNPCPTPIAPMGTCTISVGFTPLGFSQRNAQLNILSNASGGTATVALTGIPPVATLSPGIAFGTVLVGTTSPPQTSVFANTSTVPLTVSNISIGPGYTIAGSSTCTLGGVVPAGGTCNVDVTVTPLSPATTGTSLSVATTPSSGNPSVPVTSTAVAPNAPSVAVNVSPATVVLGNSASVTLTLSNTNNAPATGVNLSFSYAGTPAATGLVNNCGGSATAISALLSLTGGTIPANGNCTISINLTYPATGTYPMSVPLSGLSTSLGNNTVVANGSLTVSPVPVPAINVNPSLNFAAQLVGNTSAAQVITVTNIGNANLVFSGAPAVTGDFAISSTTCAAAAPVAAGGNCVINVTFTPTATGNRTGTISIASNVAGSPTVVNLTGTGASPPTVTVLPATAPVGSTFNLGLKLTNTAVNVGLNGINATVNYPVGFTNVAAAGGFPQAGCGATVAGYATGGTSLSATNASLGPVASGSLSCNAALAQVTAPATPGVYSFTIPAGGLTMSSPGAYSNATPITVSFTVTANAPTQSMGLAPAAVAAGSPSTLTLTLTNNNGAPATGISFNLNYPVGITGVAAIPAGTNCGGSLAGTNTSHLQGTGMSIPPFGACTVTVAVTGSTPGNYALTLPAGALNSSFGSNAALSTATLTVLAANAPSITFAPASLNLGSQAVGGTSAAQTVTLTNSGNAALTIGSITLSGDFAFFSDCPLTPLSLAQAANCLITVDFSPLTQGAQNSAVVVNSNASNGITLSVPVAGTGTPQLVPNIAVAPGTLTFGNQAVGSTSAVQSVIVTNTGQANLTLSGITLTGAGYLRVGNPAAGVTVPSCGATLAPSASCHISVVLAPLSTGSLNGSIVVVHNAPGSPATVTMTGTGTPRPQALITTTTALAFGDQIIGTSSATQNITISNSGTLTLNIASITLGGANASQFTISGNCVVALAPGAQCSLLARFAPSTLGAKAASLVIVSDAVNTPNAAVALTGNGVPVPVPVVRLSATLLGFGNVIYGSTPATQGIILSNIGTAPLQIVSIAMSGNSDFQQSNACGTSVAAGAQCNIGISFAPHAIGARSGVLTIRSNAAGSPHTIPMTGTGCRYFSPAAARFFLTSC